MLNTIKTLDAERIAMELLKDASDHEDLVNKFRTLAEEAELDAEDIANLEEELFGEGAMLPWYAVKIAGDSDDSNGSWTLEGAVDKADSLCFDLLSQGEEWDKVIIARLDPRDGYCWREIPYGTKYFDPSEDDEEEIEEEESEHKGIRTAFITNPGDEKNQYYVTAYYRDDYFALRVEMDVQFGTLNLNGTTLPVADQMEPTVCRIYDRPAAMVMSGIIEAPQETVMVDLDIDKLFVLLIYRSLVSIKHRAIECGYGSDVRDALDVLIEAAQTEATLPDDYYLILEDGE